MDNDVLGREVDANYEAFLAALPNLLPEHRDSYALMRHGRLEGYYSSSGRALAAGREAFGDGVYSIQEVTDRAVDLGFFSHAVDSRIA